MNALQRKRLLRLTDFIVAEVPKEKFDMGRFGTPDGMTPDCGTSGCAIGWCTVFFKRTGVTVSGSAPAYKGFIGIDIAMPLFGLTSKQAFLLFSGKNVGQSAKQVRRSIINLVNKLDKAKAN